MEFSFVLEPQIRKRWKPDPERLKLIKTLPVVRRRFWENVVKTDSCWYWTGPIVDHGYGQYSITGVHIMAHRYAWEAEVGEIPYRYQIHHKCGTKNCVRPSHLESLSVKDHRSKHKRNRYGQMIVLK